MSVTSRERAVESLVALGLREYEAKCFVALSQLVEGTAKEVSQVADVPRSRVYDSVQNLEQEGLVDVQQTSPLRYRAVSVETALEILEREHRSHIDAAEDALSTLGTVREDPDEANTGIWTVRGDESVTERGCELIEDADGSVYVAAVEPVGDEVLEWIETAADAGLSVAGTLPSSVREQVRQRVDAGALAASFVDAPALDGLTRLLVTDGDEALVGARTQGSLPNVAHETALYTEGTGIGPVVSRLVARYVESLDGDSPFAAGRQFA